MSQALDSLLTCLRFPSISTDSGHAADVRECSEWLALQLSTAGLATQVHSTPGHPIIVAKNPHQPGRPTVLLYGHYDVQPVDPLDLWDSPPFEPRIEDGVIYARGATDNKGQLMAHLCGLRETMLRDGDLPVNLTVLFEGEEEIGSPNLAPFLEQNRGSLACDLVAISDTGMVGPGIPTFTYGLRGIACCEVTMTGPSVDLHSGIFGGAVANPAVELARLIGQIHDGAGRVRIDGFYDGVKPLADWEREGWAKLPFDDAAILRLTGSPALHGEEGFSSVERTWARPTAEVNGLWGGYQGEGSKTVIPSKAFAKFSFRLVPDQDPEVLMERVEAWLASHTPPTVTLEIHRGHSGRPYLVDPHSRFGRAAQSALRATFNAGPALIREGGSIPIVHAFKQILGADTLLLGLALPDCRAQAPNENFPVANFEAGMRLNQELLRALATA
jgi:acetylornithine deacetylase/succinyl-diaminopimelate desuccinylase-like protein